MLATCACLGQLSLSCQTQSMATGNLAGGHLSSGLVSLLDLLLHRLQGMLLTGWLLHGSLSLLRCQPARFGRGVLSLTGPLGEGGDYFTVLSNLGLRCGMQRMAIGLWTNLSGGL